MNVESSILRDAKELIVWASKLEARLKVEIHEDPPDPVKMEALDRLHPDLGTLYNDHSGIYVHWELSPEYWGQLWIVTPDDRLREASNDWKHWSDDEVIETVIRKHSDPNTWLPIARSLVPFYDYGSGDSLCVSQLDRKVYYREHEEGELIFVCDNLNDFYRGWSTVRYADPGCGWRDVGLLGYFSEQLFELPDEPADLDSVGLKDILLRTTRKLTAREVRRFEAYFPTYTNLVQLKKYLESGSEITLVRWKREDKLGEHLELLDLVDAQYRVVNSNVGLGLSDR